jgi:hypothetical protein
MRSEHSEAFRRYLQAQPKAIAYSERLQAENQGADQWVMLAASLAAMAIFVANLLA